MSILKATHRPVGKTPIVLAFAVALAIFLGCSSVPKEERGPDGTRAYRVNVETDPPGAKIEVNGNLVGESPVTITVYGDQDRTFHNFGSYQFIVKAFPISPGQNVQEKVFHTGGWFTSEDQIPSRIYFNLNLDTVKPKDRIEVEIK